MAKKVKKSLERNIVLVKGTISQVFPLCELKCNTGSSPADANIDPLMSLRDGTFKIYCYALHTGDDAIALCNDRGNLSSHLLDMSTEI